MISPFRLKTTIGRENNVDLNDVRRVKKALRYSGYFETPSYGLTDYPDEPLFEAIEKFQTDNGLHRDGIMKPTGETATTLGERLAKVAISENETPEADDVPKVNAKQTAFAPAIPAIVYEIAVYMGMTVSAAWAWWQTKSEAEKNAIIATMKGDGDSPGEEDLEHCDHLHYNVDIPTCRNISKKRGKAAGERCYASAMSRYDACLRGVEIDRLPPLDTWGH